MFELKRLVTARRYLVERLSLTAEAAGQHEEAIACARRAWDEREPSFICARHSPPYRTLHADPRFAAILREMGSPEENEGTQLRG